MRLIVTAVLALAAVVPVRPGPGPLTVSAAVSLADVLGEVVRGYRGAGGGEVRLNFASSNILARQIASGAPVDVFISADALQMDVAAAAGAIDPATRIDLLSNRLAIVTRQGLPRDTSADARRLLTSDVVRRVAIGDPASVPAGVYARQYLEKAGAWDAVRSRLVPVGTVRAALAAAANGSVDAAIVYETDPGATSGVDVALVVTGKDAPDIRYPAAITRVSKQRVEAERFLAYLQSPEAMAVFRRYKFQPAPAGGRRGAREDRTRP